MSEVNTLDATEYVASIEAYLAQQYAKRAPPVRTWPMDGVVIIAAWLLITYIVIGGK